LARLFPLDDLPQQRVRATLDLAAAVESQARQALLGLVEPDRPVIPVRVQAGLHQLLRAIRSLDYLLKTEPDAYSFADLERDGKTVWDGVTNPTAVKHLREMKAGEGLIIYHTGDERQAVGTATVASVDAANPKVPAVKIKAGKPLSHPRTLASIKEHNLFAASPLVTQGRLSVVPLTAAQYAWFIK